MSSWVDSIAAFVGGFVNGFAQEYSSPAAYAPSACGAPRATFQNVIRALAAHLGAEVHLDDDVNNVTALSVRIQGDDRMVIVVFADGIAYLYAPSVIKFPSGCLPRSVAEFLSDRNKELDFADWDAIDKNGKAYFTLKSRGQLDRINLDVLKVAIRKMLIESATLDMFLRKEGYAG